MSKISIILPTYNVEKYIAKALDSCINQTFKDIEIIVVDDCGNDKSIDIAKEYAKKDERIKIVHNKENLKLLRARYEGVKVANSPYIMFLDPDDYLELNACEECIKILDKNKIDLLLFNALVLDINNTYNRKLYIKSGFYNGKDFIKNLLKVKDLFWNIWAKVISKKLYLKAFETLELDDNIKINMAEDALLYYPLLCSAKNIFYLDSVLYNYRINDSSISNLDTLFHIKNNISEHDLVISILKKVQFRNKFNLGVLNLLEYRLLLGKKHYFSKIYDTSSYMYKINFSFLLYIKKIKFKIYRFLRC